MRIDQRDHGPLLHRRQVLTTAAALGAVTLGGLGFAAAPRLAGALQIDSTPPAPAMPADPDPVADLAASLDYDVEAIATFVRTEIQYEAYPGILRGARGTLWSRAGNAADQAILLGALLDAAQVPYRFAYGQLDAAQAERLAANLVRTSDEASRAWIDAGASAAATATGQDGLPATPAADAQAMLDRFTAQGEAAIDLAAGSITASRAAIAGALAGTEVELPPLPDPVLPDLDVSSHLWIQVADGPDWIDILPALPEDAAPPVAAGTTDIPQPEWQHQLRIVIAADEYFGGAVSRREVVSLAAASQDLVGTPVALSMASADELTDLGASITQLVSGQKTIYPSIFAGGTTVDATSPLVFATDAANASDPFGEVAGGITDGETVAIWLVVEIASPGGAPITVERALLDRMTPEDRASGTFAPEAIGPVSIVPTGIGDDTPDQLNTLTVIHVDVARIPPWGEFARYFQDEVFGALGLLGPTLSGFRDALGIREESGIGSWSYPSAPNLTAFHVSVPQSGSEPEPARISVDLLHRARTALPLAGASATSDVHPLVLSGVLDAVAEQLLLAPETRGELPDGATFTAGPSVAGIVAAADAAGVEVVAVSSPADLAAIDVDAVGASRLTTALDAGKIVICPVQPVEIDGAPALGWWIVDPASGHTTDLLQDGTAGGSARGVGVPVARFGNLPGYTFLTRAIAWVVANGRYLACFGAAVAYGLIAATVILGVDPNNSGAVATGGLLGGGAAGAAGGLCFGP